MSLPLKSQIFSEDPQYLELRFQQFTNEVNFLKQQNNQKDEKIKEYENEIQQLRSEKDSILQQLSRAEKVINSYKISSYSKSTNILFDRLSNISPESSSRKDSFENNIESNQNNSNIINNNPVDKAKNTFYNGIYFKKNKEAPFTKEFQEENFLKGLESKSSRKNSNNAFDLFLNEKKPNLFENFMIISSTRDSFENSIYNSNSDNFIQDSEFQLPPTTLFSYPVIESNSPIKKTLENYAFPFGVKAQKLALDESCSQLNQIIFKANNLIDQRINCFNFVIKTNDSYNKTLPHHTQSLFQRIRNFINSNNINSKDEADSFAKLNQLELLELCNSNSFLYAFGIKIVDFIESKENKVKSKKKNRFWSLEKTYCFITKYPFTKFFLEIILQILNLMKVSKMKLQTVQNSESFSKIDTDFLKNFFSSDLTKILDFILNSQKNLDFHSIIDLRDSKIPFSYVYQIPDFNKSFYLEVEWVSGLGLSNLTDEIFAFLISSILLENSVVFVSENLGLLTSTMMTFLNLINPFKWHYPIVFNLPHDLMQILESPIPILVGINRNSYFINSLYQKYNHIIFVSLDKDKKIYNKNNMNPFLNETFILKLKTIFNDFNEKLKNNQPYMKNNLEENYYFSINKELIPNPNKEQIELIYMFFRDITSFIYQFLIKLIPEKALYVPNERNLLNYEMIRGQIKNKDRDNIFLERFIQTQMLTFFLDEYYK